MRDTSQLYKTLRTQTGAFYEVQLIRIVPGGTNVTYGMDKLKTIEISPALFQDSGPQVGGVNSTQCKVKLLEQSSNWPRMASFDVKVRLSSADETQKSEWLSMGVFYTDERRADKYGNLEIVAFDGMLLLEQSWTDKVQTLPSSWPITATAAASLLVEATGVQLDSRTRLDNTVPFIGLDTTSTAREVYSTIAAGLGGNWYMTPEGKLLLVSLWNDNPGESTIAGIAVAGISIVGTSEQTIPSGTTGHTGLGMSVKSVDYSDGLADITNIEMETESGTKVAIKEGNGYTLKATCNFADSSAAALCLSRVKYYSYRPFSATGARLDPAAEIGDEVYIDGLTYQIITIDWKIGPHITANLSAPFEETVDHEYTILSNSAKTLRKSIGYTDGQIEQTRSYIQQTERSITQGVAANYVSNQALGNALSNYSPTSAIQQNYYSKQETDSRDAALASEIELTDSRLTLAFSELRTDVNDEINAMSYYIRYENGVVIVGKTDSPTSIRISNEQIALYYGNEMLSYWNQNRQYTPKELQIPTGGKFTLGDILFQPRTSGNMSLMWVGTNVNV